MLDPDLWGDPLVDWAALPVGGAVGEMTQPVQDALADAGVDLADFFGGQVRLDFLFGTPLDDVFSQAYEVDPASMEIQVDANGYLLPIPAADVHPWP